MGGYGSGMWRIARHPTVERSNVLRVGDVIPFVDPPNAARSVTQTISYRVPGQSTFADTHIKLVASRPNFGGVRWWFVCPCGRRVARLYLPRGRWQLACRRCHRLAYASQRLSRPDRIRRRARKLWHKIGEDTPWPVERARGTRRPKWMRRATYWRIGQEADDLDWEAFGLSCGRWLLRAMERR
jgi:hypothetical protein